VAGRIDDEFCGWSLNVGVGGRYPLAAESSAVLLDDTPSDVTPTSLGVVIYDNVTTLMVATTAGQLLKVQLLHLTESVLNARSQVVTQSDP